MSNTMKASNIPCCIPSTSGDYTNINEIIFLSSTLASQFSICSLKKARLFFIRLKNFWNGEDLAEETPSNQIQENGIGFMEMTSESVWQLCLKCYITREFGLPHVLFEKVTFLFSLFMSINSICRAFAKVSMTSSINISDKHAFSTFRGKLIWHKISLLSKP